MATASIVSMLLEGNGMIGGNAPEMSQYTMECGAALIARESVQELHDIFEVAIVETNEAALGAYLEGSTDVMESATYGPVFEEADKKAGADILAFLKRLKDKVFSLFRKLYDAAVLALNDYEKFYNSNKDKIVRNSVDNVNRVQWHDDAIGMVATDINEGASSLTKFMDQVVANVEKFVKGEKDAQVLSSELDALIAGTINSYLKQIGVGEGQYDTTALHEKIRELFRDKETKSQKVDRSYVEDVLVKSNKLASGIKSAQKSFNSAYDGVIKSIKAVKDQADKSNKKGASQYIHKAVSGLSKLQNIINVYASTGTSAIVARATEAKAFTHMLCKKGEK